jgi:hypothetical protein
MALSELSFSQFGELMQFKGVKSLFMKALAENDNSKNQVYLSRGDLSLMQILPNKGIYPDKKAKRENFKAKLDFYWIDDEKNINHAPDAQLILYMDYPEIRFSGFLQNSKNAPSELMRGRLKGRVMFLGVCDDGRTIGYVTTEDTQLIREIDALDNIEQLGVLLKLPLGVKSEEPKDLLLKELKRINQLGWIVAKRLTIDGLKLCIGQNCGGLTLEAELGVVANSKSEPDFLGYEVKQYSVRNFNNTASGSAITLMTPEPQGGLYKEKGVEIFVRKFGYEDPKTTDRMNFSGLHYFNRRNDRTGLTLVVDGYDIESNRIIDVNGAIALVTNRGSVAASWAFKDIMAHWSRKHNHAVYVPSQKQADALLQYRYGHLVLLAEKTDPLFLLKALVDEKVYYDPGIHLENTSSNPTTKRRSQFRIHSKNIGALYRSVSEENLLTI